MLMTSFILKACIIFKSFLKFIYILIKLSFPNAPQFFYSLHPFCYVWQNSCILWRFANIICYVTREIMTQKTLSHSVTTDLTTEEGKFRYNWGFFPFFFSFSINFFPNISFRLWLIQFLKNPIKSIFIFKSDFVWKNGSGEWVIIFFFTLYLNLKPC